MSVVGDVATSPVPDTSEAGRIARDSLSFTAGLAATWVVSLAIRLSLPQFLDAASFGRLIFCESLALLLFAPLTLGVDTLARREVPVQPTLYQRLIRPVSIVRGGSTLALAAAGAGALALLGRPGSVLVLFVCFALAHFAVNGGLINSAFLHGGGRTTTVTVTQVATKFAWAALALGGLILGGGALAIPVALAASEGLRLWWLRRRNIALFGPAQRTDWRAARVALVTCLPFAARQISVGLSNSLDTTLVGAFAGDEEVALYGVATLIAMTALFLAPALSAALLPALSRTLTARGPDAACRLGANVLNVVVALMAPITTLMALESDDIISGLFGHDYDAAVPSLRVLSLMFLFTYVAGICSTMLICLGRGWPVSLVSLVTVTVNTVANVMVLGPAVRFLESGGPSFVASCAVFAAEVISAVALFALLGSRMISRALLRTVLWAAFGSGCVITLHLVVAGNGIGLVLLEATTALAFAALGARRPIRALRSQSNTLSGHPGSDRAAPLEKEHVVVESPR